MPPSETPLFAAPGTPAEVEGGSTFMPRFDRDGLIAVIVTEEASGAILMFAWMNREALAKTLETRQAHFWSRSRGKLWRKGEESGNTLEVCAVLTDCDQDVLLLKVQVGGNGVACHTGAKSCFYRSLVLTPGAASGGLERV